MNQRELSLPVVITADAAGKIESCNPDCKALLGYSAQAISQLPVTRLFDPSLHDEINHLLKVSRIAPDTLETDLRRQDGSIFRTAVTFIPRFTSTHHFNGYLLLVGPVALRNANMHGESIQEFAEALPGMFYVIDQAGHFLLWNRRLELVTQMTHADVKATHVADFFDQRDKPAVEQKLRLAFDSGYSTLEADLLLRDGTRIPYLFHDTRMVLDGSVCICGMGLDISERRKYEETLTLYERALHASSDAIVITRCEGSENPIVYVNPAFEEVTGYRQQEVAGRDPRFMHVLEADDDVRTKLREALRERHGIQVVFRNRKKSGELFWNELRIAPLSVADGSITHFIGVITDVTKRRDYQAQLEHEANHDPLTKLANRTLLRDRLEQAVSFARRHQRIVATAFIDLDNFKPINDALGHAMGDTVLKAVAARLKSCIRGSDTVARIGGDEFVLILVDEPGSENVADLVERVRESIAQPILVNDHELAVSASIGVSVFPLDGDNPTALMHAADVAMYHAKTAGRNNCQFYSADLNAAARDRLDLEASLRQAIEQGELFLAYLPTVDLKSARIIGAEALVRWKHPTRGILFPQSFIPVAEESGLIVALGERVLSDACALLKHFNQLGLADFTVSINLSSRQFRQKNFVGHIAEKLGRAGLPISRLALEVTETQLMNNPACAIKVLSQLKEAGIGISVDDFGSGYSSLRTLKEFPVDQIKIDRSFVHGLTSGGDEATITRAVISLGHSLNLKVIAEGVETIEQLEFLRAYQCDQIQGNYFSAPIPQARLQEMVETKTMLRFR
ncbi:MAG: hypothetical protein JWQ23_497 [Herminiimonas sp.]|nr:hypothetical protein [Herminiimonas sp.]